MSYEKMYVGVGRVKDKEWGKELEISFHRDNIEAMSALIEATGNDWLTVQVKKRKEPKDDKTHYGLITYKSDDIRQGVTQDGEANVPEQGDDDLPF